MSIPNWLSRPRLRFGFLLGLVVASTLLTAAAQEKPIAFVGGRILPIAGDPIEDGVLLVQGGKIQAVGPKASVTLPADAERRDVTGKVLMPGLIDTHSHIGIYGSGVNERSGPINPEMRALDGVDIRDPSLQRARAGGITTVNIMPGSGTLIGGQTIYLKLRQGRTIEDLTMQTRSNRIAGGLKMANGTNPQGDPPFPGTRGKAAALVRERYVAAQVYRDKVARAKGVQLPPGCIKNIFFSGRKICIHRCKGCFFPGGIPGNHGSAVCYQCPVLFKCRETGVSDGPQVHFIYRFCITAIGLLKPVTGARVGPGNSLINVQKTQRCHYLRAAEVDTQCIKPARFQYGIQVLHSAYFSLLQHILQQILPEPVFKHGHRRGETQRSNLFKPTTFFLFF